MNIHSIHHAQLAFRAGDEAQIRRFYNQLIGLTEFNYGEPVDTHAPLRFVAGHQRIDLVPTDNWQPNPIPSHLAFEVQGLPTLRNRLLSADVALEESRPLVGYLRFYVKDPAGNQLEFLEPDASQASTV
ncbi:catechol 2,3-dioxygenase-like lactoylglutathione lyase family enzyme [Rhodoferax ferrireducens]|uniref:Catechol 2,3-dioxygenase-like lactoylglutathione lyase family enzyme n=1 Tax=Rhodoferax ferrireducens TaxID=192843 RepID=A0ABU2C4V6_9BURK|nr:VOC family protein [Rhodoferax ferrireducens]MDR7376370.1 catechol 2,3-dioxygenase-like lactoylglutathione lyase family enzyme [Rhodoferax ferrireducens]